jgi:DNA-binding transcriptional LysR family regulator
MSELDDLRCFVEVVENGGFTRAARRLGIAKSMASRSISRLEAELGTRLLSRTTRGVSPTDAGLEFKTRCERILADYDEAREVVASHGDQMIGRLRLSVPISFGVRHLAPVLAEIASSHPRLELDVSYNDRVVDLIAERFDAAIRIGQLRDSSLVARRIAPVQAMLVASPDYLRRHRRPETPDDLAEHECLIYTAGIATDWQFRSGRRLVSIRPRGRLRSDSGDAIVQWAEAGLGVAHVPKFLVSSAVERGALEPLLPDYPTPEAAIFVVRPPGPHVALKVRLLIEMLVRRFGSPTP